MVGNTHDLQNHRSPIGTWFKQTASKVNTRNLDEQTSQGFYVVAADGSAYVFNNNRSVERVLQTLDKGMAGFRAAPPSNVEIPQEKQWAPEPPPDATVLRVYSRIKPVPAGCDTANENLQRDHFWLLAPEVAALRKGEVPEALTLRLCRFVFVDAIRGEPDFWRIDEVKKSFKVSGTTLSGSFQMQTADAKRGLTGSVELQISKSGEVKGFAETTAWGAGTYTPNPPAGKFPLKFAFILAPKAPDTVAPQAAMFGQEYLTGQ
jgi:hypothetical protein